MNGATAETPGLFLKYAMSRLVSIGMVTRSQTPGGRCR